MSKEVEKQNQEIEAWIRIRDQKGAEFMKGGELSGDLRPYYDKTIVDIGCGPRPFVERFPAKLAVMFDCCMQGYADQGLLQASTLEKVLCIDGQAERMPFKDESVDFVFSINMLDHCYDPDKVIQEAIRVLRPGGTIHINVDLGGQPNECEPVVFTTEDIDRIFASMEELYSEEAPPSNVTREKMLIRIYRKREAIILDRPKPPELAFNAADYEDILRCNHCEGTTMKLVESNFKCSDCGATYPKSPAGIYDTKQN